MLGRSRRSIIAAVATIFVVTGCGGGSSSVTAPAPPPPPPSGLLPTGLTATVATASRIVLEWEPAPAGEGVTDYRVERGGETLATMSGTRYEDEPLFADTRFVYTVTALDGNGNEVGSAASLTARTDPFVVNDVAVGDPNASYANFEFTSDGRYMVWFEQSQNGSGLGTMWHCGVDLDTGELIPPDGRGFRAFETTAWNRANPGVDAQGPYYVGGDRDGDVFLVRPTGPTSGTVTQLPLPPDPLTLRRAFYPTALPGEDEAYVFWILNEEIPGGGVDPRNDWYELQYIDLDDPADVMVIERQDSPPAGPVPMVSAFVRWFRGAPITTYGVREGQFIQVRGFDARTQTRTLFTTDPSSKVDPYPFRYRDLDVMAVGINSSATSHFYTRPTGTSGAFTLAETVFPPASRLQDPVLAQSHERIVFDDLAYTAYQINEPGSDFLDTAFKQPGEIWLTTALQDPQQQWLVSRNSRNPKAEPEPLVGNDRIWVFYSSLPENPATITTARWELRRADTPIGLR